MVLGEVCQKVELHRRQADVRAVHESLPPPEIGGHPADGEAVLGTWLLERGLAVPALRSRRDLLYRLPPAQDQGTDVPGEGLSQRLQSHDLEFCHEQIAAQAAHQRLILRAFLDAGHHDERDVLGRLLGPQSLEDIDSGWGVSAEAPIRHDQVGRGVAAQGQRFLRPGYRGHGKAPPRKALLYAEPLRFIVIHHEYMEQVCFLRPVGWQSGRVVRHGRFRQRTNHATIQ
jgi:hypothetical protein